MLHRLLGLFFLLFPLFLFAASPTQLRFATEESPPFNYTEKKEVVGAFPEIAQAVCEQMKVICTFTVHPWAEAEWETRHEEQDALFAVAYSKERSQWLTYSDPVVQSEYGLFVQQNNAFTLKKPDDLRGLHYRIGVYGPSNTYYELQQLSDRVGDVSVVRYDSTLAALKALSKGEINAVYANKAVGEWWLQQGKLPDLRYAGKDQTVDYYFAFNKKTVSKQVIHEFVKTYRTLYHQGKIQVILKENQLTGQSRGIAPTNTNKHEQL